MNGKKIICEEFTIESGRDFGLFARITALLPVCWIFLKSTDLVDFRFFIFCNYVVEILCCLLDREYCRNEKDGIISLRYCMLVPIYLYVRAGYVKLKGYVIYYNIVIWLISCSLCAVSEKYH